MNTIQTLTIRTWKPALTRAGRLATALALALVAMALTVLQAETGALDTRRDKDAFATLPVPAQAVISGAVGRDDRAYRALPSIGGFRIENAGQRLDARFDAQGIHVRSGEARLGLELRAYGRGQALQPAAPAAPVATANRVEYRRGALTEWYVNGPLGLEQGFTLTARPAGRGPLTLSIALTGGSGASVLPNRDGVCFADSSLRYSGLGATDAGGQTLVAWLELRGSSLLLRVADAGARYPLTIDPFIQQAKLTSSDGATGDNLGISVAVSGDTVVAGAPHADLLGHSDQGAVYVFVKPAGGWVNATQAAKLTASDGASGDNLGVSVAIYGDTIVAGAEGKVGTNAYEGAAYVFVRPAGGWVNGTQTAKLTGFDQLFGAIGGVSVAISADTIVAGVPRNGFTGAALVYVKPSGGWVNALGTANLFPSDGAQFDDFGRSVAISGDTVVVGSPNATIGINSSQGAAYLFVKPAAGWESTTQTAKLTASAGPAQDYLGSSVAVSGDTVVAGALLGNTGNGTAYVFVKPAGGWVDATQTAALTASDGADGDWFGYSVAISGDTVVVGAPNAAVGGAAYVGAAYVFAKPAGGWVDQTQTVKLIASAGTPDDQLGASVAVSGDTIIGGASSGLGNPGAAYVFGPSGLDTTAPTTTIALSPAAPNGSAGWYVSDVHATVGSADADVAETRCVLDPTVAPATFDSIAAGCSFTGAGANVTADRTHRIYAASKDATGNKETPVSVSFKIDKTKPTVTCSAMPTFVLGGAGGNVSATVSDATSGPAASPVSAAGNVSSAGKKSASLTGYDVAGNSTAVSCPYLVAYNVLGFFSPLPQDSNKAGSSIAVKFALANAAGTRIPDAEALALASACKAKVRFDSDAPGCADYDSASHQFVFSVKVPKNATPGSHTITLDVFVGSDLVTTKSVTVNVRN